MTTANRPTYHPAVGRQNHGGFQTSYTSGKDQIAHTKLKFRQVGQSSTEELKYKDFKAELESKEKTYVVDSGKDYSYLIEEEEKVDVALLLENKPQVNDEALKKYDDDDANEINEESDFESSSDGSNSDSEDDDDDDELELQRELERIREERALAQAKKQQEEKELEEKMRKDTALGGNPLLNLMNDESMTSKIKRRWNDDVVFRNQSKDEPKEKRRFINDTVRSDFHRNFLKKFIR